MIEETLNTLVNQLLKGKYSDPYAFLVKSLEEVLLIFNNRFENFFFLRNALRTLL